MLPGNMKFQVIFNRLTMKNFTLQFVFLNAFEHLILAQVLFRTFFLFFFVCCCFFLAELNIYFSFVFNFEESS